MAGYHSSPIPISRQLMIGAIATAALMSFESSSAKLPSAVKADDPVPTNMIRLLSTFLKFVLKYLMALSCSSNSVLSGRNSPAVERRFGDVLASCSFGAFCFRTARSRCLSAICA